VAKFVEKLNKMFEKLVNRSRLKKRVLMTFFGHFHGKNG